MAKEIQLFWLLSWRRIHIVMGTMARVVVSVESVSSGKGGCSVSYTKEYMLFYFIYRRCVEFELKKKKLDDMHFMYYDLVLGPLIFPCYL
ncbi:hypothetical protein I3842_07G121100 [Carya illinoinensis]|uniref:Uncharacterized protein n=1 Tax=Carya illinoinensis TaxID=32201 RepID=A0A922EIY3_CARIL|nr:hypothetical protein I3842_07G121100 [Carya illinoinensis]